MQYLKQKKAISYIVISFLKINLLNGNCKGRIDAYDASFYADEHECFIDFEADCLFRPLIEITDLLKTKRKHYRNKISENDIISWMYNEMDKYYFMLIAIVRYIGNQIEEIPT